MGLAYRKEILAGDAVLEDGVFELKLKRVDCNLKNVGAEHHSHVGHLGDKLAFYVAVVNAITISNNRK